MTGQGFAVRVVKPWYTQPFEDRPELHCHLCRAVITHEPDTAMVVWQHEPFERSYCAVPVVMCRRCFERASATDAKPSRRAMPVADYLRGLLARADEMNTWKR